MQVPSILASLMRTLEANSIYRVSATEGLADLVVTLPVEGFGTLDFASHERIVEIGYDTTRESLREWEQAEAGQPMGPGKGAG
jgi:predicted acylesterase/phospholipase RssA